MCFNKKSGLIFNFNVVVCVVDSLVLSHCCKKVVQPVARKIPKTVDTGLGVVLKFLKF